MFKIACPACGAEVKFRSAVSTLAVCEYCNSTLLKDAESVKDIGKMGEVLEDYSPIQLGTSGLVNGVHFTVIGRIQLRYDAGFWNEWYVLGDDGLPGWLSDASGQYVFTRSTEANPRLPGFAQFRPGKPLLHKGKTFYASDIRTASCTAGQGELPFTVGKGWQAQVVDLRSGRDFITLDYSEGDAPQCYEGRAVTLEELKCQLLREDSAIAESAGRFRGKLRPLECPNCGNSIVYLPGMATQIVCKSCHADVDCADDTAVVLKKHDEVEALKTTLQPGDTGKFNNVSWTVLGVLARQTTDDEPEIWGEYLLFNMRNGFLWLVETGEGWSLVEVLNEWPLSWSQSAVSLGEGSAQLLYRYTDEVVYAAGAFNWRASVGDKTYVMEYSGAKERFCMERTESEIGWSRSTKMSAQQVMAAFSKPATTKSNWLGEVSTNGAVPVGSMPLASGATNKGSLLAAAIIASIILFIFTLPAEGNPILGYIILWLPVFWRGSDAS